MNIYKYLRKSEEQYDKNVLATKRQEEELNPNIVFETDETKRTKTYAVLHEPHSDFNNNYIRYILLIYSNSSWNIFLLSIMFVVFFIDTSLYTFYENDERPFQAILLVTSLNLVFSFNVLISLGLKFIKKWTKTLNLMEPDTIRIIVDVILALPYSILYLLALPKYSVDLYGIVPFIALCRVYRFIEFFINRSTQAGSNQWTTFLFQYLTFFIISVHTWTCLWYLFAYMDFNLKKIRLSWTVSAVYVPAESIFDWYLVCAYWSVMCLTTNALGELFPVTTAERVVAMFAITLGFILTTVVFVGSLTSQFITITTRRSLYVMQLKKIQNHLALINMDPETTSRIIRYYEDLWYQKSGVFKPTLLRLLPYPLQMEICYDLNAIPLYSSLVFRKQPEAFLRRLSLDMSHQFFLPGDVVYEHNQNKTTMVCITSGVLEFLSDEDDESPMISFGKGTCFGEVSLVLNIPARCTVKAATYVECQVLEKTAFFRLMMTYPDIVAEIRKDIYSRIQRSQSRMKKSGRSEPITLNIYASKEKKKSSIKLLKEKLRYIQGKTDEDLTKHDVIDENCLDLYILNEHVKKKISKFTCVNSKFPWILEHNCIVVKCWEILMLFFVLYICTVYPYFIGFKRYFPGGLMFYAEIVTNIAICLNLVMNVVTAVKTKKKYINKFWDIVDYQMNTLGFYLDLIALIPFEHLATIYTLTIYQDKYRAHLFFLCKGFKLCLVWRISSFFQKLEKNLLFNTIVVKVSKYCIYLALLSYWCGVILYTESCFVNRCHDNSWFAVGQIQDQISGVAVSKTAYPIVTSIYFATTVIFSVGYGDFSPGDFYDMGFVAFSSLYGVLLAGYCVAEFSSVVTHWSRAKTEFLEVILTIDKFMKENNMHPSIKARIMAFYDLQWQYNAGVDLTEQSWLKDTIIPAELRRKVLHQARFKTLTSTVFFQVKNKAFIHTLTEMARDVILPPGEILFYGGTISRELYIIESGYCRVTSRHHRENKTETILGPGQSLGLLVLLYGIPAVDTVITLTHCKFITINHYAYTSALSLFPEMKEHQNLLRKEELLSASNDLRETKPQKDYLQRSPKRRIKITSLLDYFLEVTDDQEPYLKTIFFIDSFINVKEHYSKQRQSYLKSYKQFHILNNIAPYLLMPVVIKPDGIFLKVWANIRLITAMALCLVLPIMVALAPLNYHHTIIVFALESICYVDIYLMLHVAYYGSKNQLIYHPYLTAKNYLMRGFTIDLLTTFPWYAMCFLYKTSNDAHEDMFTCVLRLINVLQIYRLYAAFWTESIQDLKRVYIMSVLYFLFLTLFFLNLYTSIMITLSCTYIKAIDPIDFKYKLAKVNLRRPFIQAEFHRDGNMICSLASWIGGAHFIINKHLEPAKVYLLACYWSATSFSGAGFGDITAHDTTDMLIAICNIVHGVLFFGYVYAKIASLKALADQVLTKFQEDLKHLELFLNREKISLPLKRSVVDYWKYQWKRTGGWSHQAILGKLHTNLNEDAVLYMYEKTLREIPLFENVQNSFFRAFAKQLSEKYFQKGYMIMRSNEVIDQLYIIYRGKVDIISDVNEVEACIGPGGIFGNIKGASQYLTVSNIVASRNIDLLAIKGSDFYTLLKSYPSVLRKVKQSVDLAPKDYVLPTTNSSRTSFEIIEAPPNYQDYIDDFDFLEVASEGVSRSVAESFGSRSQMDLSNTNFLSALSLTVQPHKWFRASVTPDCLWVVFIANKRASYQPDAKWHPHPWKSSVVDRFMLCVAYVDFLMLVYEMAFMSIDYYIYICIVFDVIFLYKLFLDIHTGYMNRYGDYVLNPKKVREKYFSNVLLRRRDFIANVPICYLAFALPLKPLMASYLFIFLRSPQLFRITYVFTFKLHRSIGSSNLLVKLSSIAIWASLLSHVNACVFFKLSCLTHRQCTSSNWMTKDALNLRADYGKGNFFSIYIASLWYMINLLTITGTGDVSAQNDLEIIETTIITIITKFCTGLLISEMSALITAHMSSRISYDYAINELKDGLRDMDLSSHQMTKMWAYVRELWNRQQGKQMPELIYNLPFRLRCQIMQAVYGGHINESAIFKRTARDFRRMLAMWMRHCVFFPGNYIVQCGDSDQCIYFIHRGEVEVLTVHPNLTESIYDILGPEDSFGVAQGLFVGVPHHFSFRARTVVDIVYLKLEQWKYLLDFYPKSAKIIHKKVENVYRAT